MRKILLFFLPLLCLTACELQTIDNPTFLNGTWENEVPSPCGEKWRITFQKDKLLTNYWRFTHGDYYYWMDMPDICPEENKLFFWNYKLDDTKTYRWNLMEVDKNVSMDTITSVPFDPIENSENYETYVFKRRGNTLFIITENGVKIKFHKLKN